MPDAIAMNVDTTEDEQIQDEKPKEENVKNGQNSGDVISFDMAKLISYRNNLKELRESILPKLSDELKEVKKACSSAKKAIGELNDNNRNRKRRKPRKRNK